MQEPRRKQKREERRTAELYPVQEAVLLSAVLAAELAAALCCIPAANILGSRGRGIYGCAVQIYLLGIMSASFGIPAAVAKIMKSGNLQEDRHRSFRVFLCALIMGCVLGMMCSFVIFFASEFLSDIITGTPDSGLVFRFFAPGIFLSVLWGVMEGYFRGKNSLAPAAAARGAGWIIGAFGMIAGAVLFPLLMDKTGKTVIDSDSVSVYRAAGSALGLAAGALIALILLSAAFRAEHVSEKKQWNHVRPVPPESIPSIVRSLTVSGFPFLILSLAVSAVLPVGIAIFVHAMENRGFGEAETLSCLGNYLLKYRTMILIPIIITCGSASGAIPALAASYSKGVKRIFRLRYDQALRISAVISIPSWIALTVFAAPVSEMLFSDPETAVLLWCGAATVIFSGFSFVTVLLLLCLGHMAVLCRNMILSLLGYLTVLWVMISVFQADVRALAGAELVFSLILCSANHFSLKKMYGFRINRVRTFGKTIAASAVMGAVGYALYLVLDLMAGGRIFPAAVSLIVSALVYCCAVLKLGVLSGNDIRLLPAGGVILYFCRGLHLLPQSET